MSIRAFGSTSRFIDKSDDLLSINNKSNYLTLVSNRWLGIFAHNLGNLVVLGESRKSNQEDLMI